MEGVNRNTDLLRIYIHYNKTSLLLGRVGGGEHLSVLPVPLLPVTVCEFLLIRRIIDIITQHLHTAHERLGPSHQTLHMDSGKQSHWRLQLKALTEMTAFSHLNLTTSVFIIMPEQL